MADRKKLTDKQAVEMIAAYQRGEALPAGTIIDFTEPPYVFHSASAATPVVTPDSASDSASATSGKDGK